MSDYEDLATRISDRLRIPAGHQVHLSHDWPANETFGLITKENSHDRLAEGVERLREYQQRLAAQERYAVVLMLQGIDASGKDGTIRHVMSGVNPQGVEVHAFKVPSEEERQHDYLWRYHQRLPARGRIGIFNRSHYESVLVERVHADQLPQTHLPKIAPDHRLWERRYREINNWEEYLHHNGIVVVKVLLHISRDEQRERLLARIDDPRRNWKFAESDLNERRYWSEYQRAFSEMLSHTSTTTAPWYVVPADHKWFARAATASILITALAHVDPEYPTLSDDGLAQMRAARDELTTG